MDKSRSDIKKAVDDIILGVNVDSPNGADPINANLSNLPFRGNAQLTKDCRILKVDLLEFYMGLNYDGGTFQYNKMNFSDAKLKFILIDNVVSWNIDGNWQITIEDMKNKTINAEFIAKIPLIFNIDDSQETYSLALIFSSKANLAKHKSVVRVPSINLIF